MAGDRLINGVVEYLGHQVVKSALIRAADVHTRALAHRLEALENLDVPGGVAACFPGLLFGNGEKIRVYRHARQSFTLKIGVQYLFRYIALMRHKRKPLSTSEGLKLRAN